MRPGRTRRCMKRGSEVGAARRTALCFHSLCHPMPRPASLFQNSTMERAFSPYLLDCLNPGATPQAGIASRLQRSNYIETRYLEAPKARSISAWGAAPGYHRNRKKG